MIYNGHSLINTKVITPMFLEKHQHKESGTSYGLGEAGYDIRIKQGVHFVPHPLERFQFANEVQDGHKVTTRFGRFVLASAIEHFQMPEHLVAIVHDKSTWARRGLSVFNTVIEPGWHGFLTLELVYHGSEELYIPAGSGIAQVVFHGTSQPARYDGKYQGQADEPVCARHGGHKDAIDGDANVTTSKCPECSEILSTCPSGLVCKNGHGFGY